MSFCESLACNYDQIVLLQWFSYHNSVTTIRHYEICVCDDPVEAMMLFSM
jgi:hypothetical protein